MVQKVYTYRAHILHYAVLILLAFISLAPIWVMVATSFKQEVVIQSEGPLWLLFTPTLENYGYVMYDNNFFRYLKNSLIVGLSATVITLFFGSLCAYALARFDFKGRAVVANATLLVRMVPPAVLAVPAFSLVMIFSLDADLMILTFFYTALNLPFCIWLLYGFYKQIPEELEEAAIVDGATPLQVFFKIMLPLMKSGYAVSAIFVFRIAWNEFILALLLTGRTTRTLPVTTGNYITDMGVEWGNVMALGTLIVIPPLLFTFFAAKQIIAGMTAGAVKG